MGAGMESNFSSLSMDEKLPHMYEKLQSLEQSNQTIAQFSQNMNTVQSKVGQFENKLNDHDLFFKVLAYKFMDIDPGQGAVISYFMALRNLRTNV